MRLEFLPRGLAGRGGERVTVYQRFTGVSSNDSGQRGSTTGQDQRELELSAPARAPFQRLALWGGKGGEETQLLPRPPHPFPSPDREDSLNCGLSQQGFEDYFSRLLGWSLLDQLTFL